MKKIFAFLIICAAMLQVAWAEPLPVFVSIVPQKYFVEKIGGDMVRVSAMVRPGASPATYEPSPGQMAELSKAKLYFAIGVPFEAAWLPRIKGANKDLTVVETQAEIKKVPIVRHEHGAHEKHAEHNHGHDHGHGHGHGEILDPHIWLSPALVKIQASNILKALVRADQRNEEAYRANFKAFMAEIDTLDQKLKNIFSNQGSHREFLVFHPSWGYFADDYGLVQTPIESKGGEPGPRELAQLISLAKSKGVKVIFIQPQFSKKAAATIASAIGGRVEVADPLAADWDTNLLRVAQIFKSAAR